jgi:SAM-dependent methyltransferase
MPSGLQLAHCRVCDLYVRREPPPSEALTLFYERDYPRRFAAEQTGARDNLQIHALRRIQSRARPPAHLSGHLPIHLIDVGCGNGKLLELTRQTGWTATGIDPSGETAGMGQQGGIEIRRASWPLPDIPGNSADAVVFLNVLDHLPDPFASLQAAWRVLRPGGVLYLRVPNGPFHVRLLTGRWGRMLSALPVFHLYGFGRNSLNHFLARTGFSHIEIRTAPVSRDDAYSVGEAMGAIRSLAKTLFKASYGISTCVGLDRFPWGPSIEALASKPGQDHDHAIATNSIRPISPGFDAQDGAPR